jgi:hypothetical protein
VGGAIGDLLPSAVEVALSPIPIIAVILMLATARARSNGLAFGLGWIVGLVAVSVVVLVAAADADTSSRTSDGVNWIKLVLGVGFARSRRPPLARASPRRCGTRDAQVDVHRRLVHRRQVVRSRDLSRSLGLDVFGSAPALPR